MSKNYKPATYGANLKTWVRPLLSLVAIAFLTSGLSAQQTVEADDKTEVVRVLTIGNSFANNACLYLKPIAESANVRIEIGTANLGGCTLERHARLASQSDLDPSVKPYRDGREKKSLQEYLRSQKWDFVTLQQMSALSFQPESYHPYLEQLVGHIKENAPKAAMLMHQTWAYRPDSRLLKSKGMDQQAMYEGLQAAYADASRQISAPIIPVGTAFQLARNAPGHEVLVVDPDFDYKNPVAGSLPKQTNSLVTGWHWRDVNGKPKLQLDTNHANKKGCFLAGLVWYEVLTGKDARQTSYLPEGFDPAEGTFFREIAHQAVQGRADR